MRWTGLLAGPFLAGIVYALLPATALAPAGRATAAIAALMAIWWLTEALPLAATALVPIVLLPITGAGSIRDATAPYANPVIFLFLGGFVLGLAMQRWGLHRRIALVTILLVGTGPRRLIAGFMLATAVMSMWVSNTATAIMMLPIGVSVIELVRLRLGGGGVSAADARASPSAPEPPAPAARDNFAVCLLLGIGYAASIGGVGTLIGTPPNIILKGVIQDRFGQTITFVQWMMLGLPIVALLLPAAWLYLTRLAYPVRLATIPGGRELIRGELRALGPMQRGEWIVFIVFSATALAWIFRVPIADTLGLYHLSPAGDRVYRLTDEGIAIAAALALFLIPVDLRQRVFAMDWTTAEKLPWGILILFGGGLSLAAAIGRNGVDAFIGQQFAGLEGLPVWALVAIVTTVVIFLTELTSNTAVTNTLLPILAAAAVGLAVPADQLMIPAAIAASFAFMLPVATPPNAIVFASGHLRLAQMVKAGFWLNLIGVVVVTLAATQLAPRVLHLQLSPDPAGLISP